SDRHTGLSGVLRQATGQPATDFSVVVMPASRELRVTGSRRIRSARPATNGRFEVVDLPPGDYVLFAVNDLDPEQLSDLRFLEAAEASVVAVSLGEGEQKRQDIRLSGGGAD